MYKYLQIFFILINDTLNHKIMYYKLTKTKKEKIRNILQIIS